MSRILVAMSGGVDSSLAAAILVDGGHDVVGVTMKTYCYGETPENPRTCCGLDGILDARRVADSLGIPHYVFDVEEEFTADVIDDFVSEYARGRTPNPCVNCNGTTKFGGLLERGRELGCERIASGHYARIRHGPGRSRLLRGVDANKDQSYYLWSLPRALLPQLLFPVGELTKEEVRERARAHGLATADKPESQDVCFVPAGSYRDLMARKLHGDHPAFLPGNVVKRDGQVVGRHDGYAGFTVGQRRRLGGGFPERLFVLEILPETREIVVGNRDELYVGAFDVASVNWLAPRPSEGARIWVQARHRGTVNAAVVTYSGKRVKLRFEAAIRAAAPGQSAVFFDDEGTVLGGGRIERALPAQRLSPDALANPSMASSSSPDSLSGISTNVST